MFSSSGAPSSRVTVVPSMPGLRPVAKNDSEGVQKLPRQPKNAFELTLPEWVVAGKPKGTGAHRALWWLYTRLALYKFKWIPQPASISSVRSTIAESQEEINGLRRQSMAIVAVITAKGGATKTTVSTWLSAVLKSITHQSLVIFDVDRGGGKVAKRFGFDPKKVMTTNTFAQHITTGGKFNHSMLTTMTESDPLTGVMIFHSLPAESVSSTKMIEVIEVLKTEIHTLVIDTGPGFRVPSTNAAASASNVQVLVGNANSDDDMNDIEATLAHTNYGLVDFYDRQQGGPLAVRSVHKSVVIAISGLPRHKCNTRSQYAYAERYGVKPENIVLIPFNSYLRRTGRVHLSALEPRTFLAFCQLGLQVARVAAASNRTV